MIDEEEKVDSKLASIERVDIWPVGNKLMNLYRFLLSQGKAISFQYSQIFLYFLLGINKEKIYLSYAFSKISVHFVTVR